MTIIPLAPPLLAGSSGLPGSFERAVLVALPYLALLRAGFCLPPVLPRARCALTAPFHPYPPSPLRAKVGGIFSVPLSFELPRPGVTRRTALRSSDFPLAFAPFGRYGAAGSPLVAAIGRACRAEAREAREGGRSSVPLRRISHQPPVRFRIAPASCTDCCAACRSLRPSLRCSNCSRGVCRRGTSAQPTP